MFSERGGESCSERRRLLDERDGSAVPWPVAHCARLMSVTEEGAAQLRLL